MSHVQKKSSRSLRVEFLGDMKKSDFFRVQDGEEVTIGYLPNFAILFLFFKKFLLIWILSEK